LAEPSIQELLENAIALHNTGQVGQAETLYRQVLARQPDHPEALRMFGLLSFRIGRQADAVDLIRRAIASNPSAGNYYSDLGVVMATFGQMDEAIRAFEQALRLSPDDAAVRTNLAAALQQKGRIDEAIGHYRHAISLRPDLPETRVNLASALLQKRMVDDAIRECRAALLLRPDLAEAFILLGNAFVLKADADQAIAAYRQAITLRPDIPVLHYNLAKVFLQIGQLDGALEELRHAIARDPGFADAHTTLAHVLMLSGDLDGAANSFRTSEVIHPDSSVAGSLLYLLHFRPGSTPSQILQESIRWNERYARPVARTASGHSNSPEPERRIRVGYVSPYFREHPVGRFLLSLLANHDHASFEVHCYSDVVQRDALTAGFRQQADAWNETVHLDDEQLATSIRDDRIDLLVDLTMHMHGTRMLAFARKPAPVQVTYLAYCSTTGLQTIDYRLSDPYLDPEQGDDSVYSEKTIRLPQSYWCYHPLDVGIEPSPLPALTTGHVTFGCLNNYSKVTPAILSVWTRILRQVPNSRLLLHAHEGSHRQRARDYIASKGVDPQRLEFVGLQPLAKYLETYCRIDIALDPFPYGGGTTTLDALWMGVPTVTLCGATAVSRGGRSIMTNAGLPELIASDPEQYVRIAAGMASDLPRLAEMRSGLRRRLQDSPLMDARSFATGVESAFRQMWSTWCERHASTR
jgi:protein O-GlcNAc transferase